MEWRVLGIIRPALTPVFRAGIACGQRFQVEVGLSGVEIQVSKQIDVLLGDGGDRLDQVQHRHVAGRLLLLVDTRQEGRIVVDDGIGKES